MNFFKNVKTFVGGIFHKKRPGPEIPSVTKGEIHLPKFREIQDPNRLTHATRQGHIHNHRTTWVSHQPARTHAWYRRHNQIPPTRRQGMPAARHYTALQILAMMRKEGPIK